MIGAFMLVIIVLGFVFIKWLLPIIRNELEYRWPGLPEKIYIGMGILGLISILLKFLSQGA